MQHERSDELVVLDHGDAKPHSHAANFDARHQRRNATLGVSRMFRHVGDVDDGFGRYDVAKRRFRGGRTILGRMAVFGERSRHILCRHDLQPAGARAINRTECGAADADGVFQRRCEYGF